MKKYLILLVFMVPVSVFAGKIQLYLENDVPFHDDSDYSHGTRIGYETENNIRFGLQQQMYTPYDISTEDQVPGRHPYAGYLAGFAGIRLQEPVNRRISVYSDLELQLGVLGPSSLADDTQKFVHKVIGSKEPKGWKHQLKDEFEVQTSLWRGFDWRFAGQNGGWSAHFVPEIGGLLGTLQIAPGANAEFRFGYGLERLGNTSEISVRAVKPEKMSVFLLFGAEGRLWLRNELLEGNARYVHNHDTLTVDMETWTGCLKAGIGFGYDKFDVRALVLEGSREYKTQERRPNYASLEIGFGF